MKIIQSEGGVVKRKYACLFCQNINNLTFLHSKTLGPDVNWVITFRLIFDIERVPNTLFPGHILSGYFKKVVLQNVALEFIHKTYILPNMGKT